MALDSASNFGNSAINSTELKLYFEEELKAILREERTEEECVEILSRFNNAHFEIERDSIRDTLVVTNIPDQPTPREMVEQILMLAINKLSDSKDFS